MKTKDSNTKQKNKSVLIRVKDSEIKEMRVRIGLRDSDEIPTARIVTTFIRRNFCK